MSIRKEGSLNIPKEHSIEIIVKKEHLDELNHVNNVIYFEFLQEVAISHWQAIAPIAIIDAVRWVVKKHEIEYLKPAVMGDILEIKTWVSEFTAISSLRSYEIKRGDVVIAKASTLWIALDSESMKPKRLDKSVAKLFFE